MTGEKLPPAPLPIGEVLASLVMVDAPHPAALPLEKLARECKIEFTRRGGPGGQHRNKVETAVVITHQPTGLTGQASETRSQDHNREEAYQRLRIELATGLRTRREPTAPISPLWEKFRKGRAVQINPGHPDFPALLAEALDLLLACELEYPLAAEKLALSTTQLVRLLQLAPEAHRLVSQLRVAAGKRPLK